MADLALTNVVNISVAASQTGVGAYNTSNLAIFSHEAYASASFGVLGYKIYLSPKDVATDFGTGSITYAQANSVFSQKPNILAGNGYLTVIPMTAAVQNFALSGVPASGSFTLTYNGNASAAILWNDPAATIQTKLRAVTGLSGVTVAGSLAGQAIQVTFSGVYGAVTLLTVGGTGLQTSAPAAIAITPTTTTVGETVAAAITRTQGLVQYFGLISTLVQSQADILAAAAVVQPLNKIAFWAGTDSADVQTGGKLDLLRSGGFTQSRGLYYGSDSASALGMISAYAGRALSTNFSGSNTTSTMHLKDLTGVQPDPSMTQTLLGQCQAAGADVYISLQGVAKVFCSGLNSFFDQVYNLQWLVGALQVAGFNYLAQSATKVPQTEDGIDGLKGAYRKVMDQAVACQYSAPGEWNSSTTFGDQANFLANIRQVGFYIFSQPIAKQSQAQRESRVAPLVQIALKEAGSVHSSSVVINVNP